MIQGCPQSQDIFRDFYMTYHNPAAFAHKTDILASEESFLQEKRKLWQEFVTDSVPSTHKTIGWFSRFLIKSSFSVLQKRVTVFFSTKSNLQFRIRLCMIQRVTSVKYGAL